MAAAAARVQMNAAILLGGQAQLHVLPFDTCMNSPLGSKQRKLWARADDGRRGSFVSKTLQVLAFR